MIIVRSPRPDNGYTIIRNDVLRDVRLSYRARGILTYVLSHSDNWRTDAQAIADHGKEGRQAVYAALKELQEAGYIERRRSQDKATGQWSTETVVFDTPRIPGQELAPTKAEQRPADPYRSEAAILVAEIWEPAMKGITAQPAVAVVKIVGNALRNGIKAPAIAKALKQLAAAKQTVTVYRLNEALNGTPVRGALKADQKVDWNTYATSSTGEIAI